MESRRHEGSGTECDREGSSSRNGAEREKGKKGKEGHSSGSSFKERAKSITQIIYEKQPKAANQLKNGSESTDQASNLSAGQDHTSSLTFSNLTISEQRAAHVVDQIREMPVNEQRKKIIDHTCYLPINERRPICERWINTLSESDRPRETRIFLAEERRYISKKTLNISIDQQLKVWERLDCNHSRGC